MLFAIDASFSCARSFWRDSRTKSAGSPPKAAIEIAGSNHLSPPSPPEVTRGPHSKTMAGLLLRFHEVQAQKELERKTAQHLKEQNDKLRADMCLQSIKVEAGIRKLRKDIVDLEKLNRDQKEQIQRQVERLRMTTKLVRKVHKEKEFCEEALRARSRRSPRHRAGVPPCWTTGSSFGESGKEQEWQFSMTSNQQSQAVSDECHEGDFRDVCEESTTDHSSDQPTAQPCLSSPRHTREEHRVYEQQWAPYEDDLDACQESFEHQQPEDDVEQQCEYTPRQKGQQLLEHCQEQPHHEHNHEVDQEQYCVRLQETDAQQWHEEIEGPLEDLQEPSLDEPHAVQQEQQRKQETSLSRTTSSEVIHTRDEFPWVNDMVLKKVRVPQYRAPPSETLQTNVEPPVWTRGVKTRVQIFESGAARAASPSVINTPPVALSSSDSASCDDSPWLVHRRTAVSLPERRMISVAPASPKDDPARDVLPCNAQHQSDISLTHACVSRFLVSTRTANDAPPSVGSCFSSPSQGDDLSRHSPAFAEGWPVSESDLANYCTGPTHDPVVSCTLPRFGSLDFKMDAPSCVALARYSDEESEGLVCEEHFKCAHADDWFLSSDVETQAQLAKGRRLSSNSLKKACPSPRHSQGLFSTPRVSVCSVRSVSPPLTPISAPEVFRMDTDTEDEDF